MKKWQLRNIIIGFPTHRLSLPEGKYLELHDARKEFATAQRMNRFLKNLIRKILGQAIRIF